MIKLALVVLLTFVIVAFGIANSHHIPVSFVLGAPVEIRLVFLILCTFFLGTAVPLFHQLIKDLRHDKKAKQAEELHQAIQQVERDLIAN